MQDATLRNDALQQQISEQDVKVGGLADIMKAMTLTQQDFDKVGLINHPVQYWCCNKLAKSNIPKWVVLK